MSPRSPALGGAQHTLGDVVRMDVVRLHVGIRESHPQPPRQVERHRLGDAVRVIEWAGTIDPCGMDDHGVSSSRRVGLHQSLACGFGRLVRRRSGGVPSHRCPAVGSEGQHGRHVHDSRDTVSFSRVEERAYRIDVRATELERIAAPCTRAGGQVIDRVDVLGRARHEGGQV